MSAREAHSLLSIERCKEALGSDCILSDDDLTALRGHLYELAQAAVAAAGSESSDLENTDEAG